MFLILAICLSTIPLNLATPLSPKIGRIIGGQPARAQDFPFAAALSIRKSDGQYFCGGSLLSSFHVLTSAFCAQNLLSVTVSLGSHLLDADSVVKVTTSTAIIHESFNPDSFVNDVAMLKFHMHVDYTDYIQPAEIVYMPVAKTTNYFAIGWGQVSDDAAGVSNVLNYASLYALTDAECKIYYGDIITEKMACVIGSYNQGTCIGDTGGPLIWFQGRNAPKVVGVSSFQSAAGCETLEPSGYTELETYQDWIQSAMDA